MGPPKAAKRTQNPIGGFAVLLENETNPNHKLLSALIGVDLRFQNKPKSPWPLTRDGGVAAIGRILVRRESRVASLASLRLQVKTKGTHSIMTAL
jgi:hypothetical protein